MDEIMATVKVKIDEEKGLLKATPNGIWCKELPDGEDRTLYLRMAATRFNISESDYMNICLGEYDVVPGDDGYYIQLPA